MKKIALSIISLLFIVLIIIVLSMLIKVNKGIDNIKSFEYYYHSGMGSSYGNYKIKCKNKCIASIDMFHNGISMEESKEISSKQMNELITVLNKYKVNSWNGFNGNVDAFDGDTFKITIIDQDNNKITAKGYIKKPKNYNEVEKVIENTFDELFNYKEKLYK